MKKIAVFIFAVNAQDGFVVLENSQQIVAAYNHHTKTLAWQEGFNRDLFDLPANYEDYKDIAVAGHFNVGFYDMATGENTDLAEKAMATA